MTDTIVRVPIDQFSNKELVGRSDKEVKQFAEVLLASGRVMVPVLATTLNKKPIVMDGIKRVMACRYIVENELGETKNFETVPTVFTDKLNPKERAVITISANEHRSDNEIAAYLKMEDLIKRQKWEEYAALFKFNKSRFKKLSKLNKLVKRELFFDAFHDGDVAMGTIFTVAGMSPERQKMCRDKLKKDGKLTAGDVREVKQAGADVVLGSMDFDLSGVDRSFEKKMFIYMDDEILAKTVNWTDAMASGKTGELYRLEKVGHK